MRELVQAAWRIEGPRQTFHVGDICWRLRLQPGRDPAAEVRLWSGAGDRLVGFAWRKSGKGDTQCRPGVARAPLESRMLAWLEEQALAAGSERLTVGGFEGDAARGALLEARGYERSDTCLRHMRIALDPPPTQAPVAAGYAVQSAARIDVPAQARAIARAFGTEPSPPSTYFSVRASPHYRNELDVVVRAPSGEVASFARGWIDEANRVGLLEPVGTDPDHRRRGLARAAVSAAVLRMRALGARSAVAYAASDDPGVCALYRACGFLAFADDHDWRKRLAGA